MLNEVKKVVARWLGLLHQDYGRRHDDFRTANWLETLRYPKTLAKQTQQLIAII